MTTERVLRGGSCCYIARSVRSARRGALVPGSCLAFLSFRPVAKARPIRVLRGSSYLIAAWFVRCAARHAIIPGVCGSGLGLRPVAKAAPPGSSCVLR
jgi:formylglycine-generating enzyme required for sulfatase activity